MKDPKKEYEKSHKLIIKEALSNDDDKLHVYDLCSIDIRKELELMLTGDIKENKMEKMIFEAVDPWEIVNYSDL